MSELVAKDHLREFEDRLSERMRQASTAPRTARLGLMIGGQRWLVELAQAGEIVPVPSQITPVPLTRPWFRGLVNLRGALYGVTDFSAFMGGMPTPVTKESRLLALSSALNLNAALLVTRMLGLHDAARWATVPDCPPGEAWTGERWIDPEGREWCELSLSRLSADPRFLAVGR